MTTTEPVIVDGVEVNVAALRETLEFIKANPEQWDQSNWARKTVDCGTACCFAGTRVLLDGGTFLFDEDDVLDYGIDIISTAEVDGKQVYIAEYAQEALGLSLEESDILFSASNSLEDLERLIDNLANGISNAERSEDDPYFDDRDADDD